MTDWTAVRAARLPAAGLGALAAFRCRSGPAVTLDGDDAWVTWPGDDPELVAALRPVPGVRFLGDRGGRWYPFGSRIPCAAPPTGGVPLDRVLHPAPLRFAPAELSDAPTRLGIVRGGGPRPATAVRCGWDSLTAWADGQTAFALGRLRATHHAGRVLLLGDAVPALPDGERFAGRDVLVPLGFRVEPDWPEAWVRWACGVADDELLLLDEDGAEAIPRTAFASLTRAAVPR